MTSVFCQSAENRSKLQKEKKIPNYVSMITKPNTTKSIFLFFFFQNEFKINKILTLYAL